MAKEMQIERLINDAYQVTDGSTIWYQGSLQSGQPYTEKEEKNTNE